MEMDYWRRCCKLTKLDREKSEEIERRMEIDIDIMETIEVKKLRWYGHVQRMDVNRWPKRVMQWVPPHRIKRGRPKKEWKSGIEEAMEKRNL